MAQGKDLNHHYISNPALAYFPNSSVTSKEPAWISGSNVMTSIKGYAERRNGFTSHLADTTFTFSGSIARFFNWRRWTGAAVTLSGAYFTMYNVITSSSSLVYKQREGTDAYPVQIFNSASVSPFDFVVSNNYLFFGNGTDMEKYDGSSVTLWGITGPSAAVTYSTGAGSLSPSIGYQWVIAWENSTSGQMSSPSPAMVSTGSYVSTKFTLTGNTTTDTQVDKVRVFRTIDGGSIYFEHPSSPVAYATWIVSGLQDNSSSTKLSTAVAPLPNQNNRPPSSQGSVWFANRVWTFMNDTLYYSNFEELVRGVEEESFSSTNQRFIGREITGLAVAGSFLLIFTADAIYRIYGDSLATFRFDTLATGKGALNRAAIVSVRSLVAWLDSSNCVFVTDGQTVSDQDLSFPIRSDISSIVHSTAAMAFHSTGNQHWLILMAFIEYYKTVALSYSPSLYLRFGEASGTAAFDSSGNNLTGTYVGSPTLGVTGAISQDSNTAITLNGTTQYVTVPDNNLLDPGDTFTLECWIKPATLAGSPFLFDKGSNGYALYCNGAVITLRKGDIADIAAATVNMTVGLWYHVVATKSGPTVHIYLNGVDVTGVVTNATIAATATNLFIGEYSGGGSFCFNGSVDEVAIFPTALTAAQVLAIYNAGIITTRSLTSGANLFVYDLDTKQWMIPWPVGNSTAAYSGQTAPATYQFFLGRNNKPLVQDANYQDDGASYTASAVTGLFDLTAISNYRVENPSTYGVLDHVEVETNATAVAPSNLPVVSWLTDEDPTGASYQATYNTGNAPPNRTQGNNLVETWFHTLGDPNMKAARRISLQFAWTAANASFKLYGFAAAYKVIDE